MPSELETLFLLAIFPVALLGRPLYRKWERAAAERAGYSQPPQPWKGDGPWSC